MKKGHSLAIAGLIALPLVFGVGRDAAAEGRTPLCSDLTCSTCVYIDLFDAAHTTPAPAGAPHILPDINGGKGVSVGKLIKDQVYLVTVSGRVSYWFKSLWDFYGSAGSAHQPPLYYSDAPGAPARADQTHTGYDWGCLFAFPAFPNAPTIPLPATYPSSRISLDAGATYGDLPQLGGLSCSPDHTYSYLVVGKGMESFFRISDTGPTYDNYGKYRICVQAVCCNSPECKPVVPAAVEVDPALMIDGVFDPRLKDGITEK